MLEDEIIIIKHSSKNILQCQKITTIKKELDLTKKNYLKKIIIKKIGIKFDR
jgi:hypothetical protein